MTSSVIQESPRDGSAQPAYHALEAGIDADLESPGALPHRSRHAKSVERQDAAGIGRPPRQLRHFFDPHRKDPAPIGVDYRLRLEVTSDSDEIVVGPTRGGRKTPAALSHGLRRPVPARHPAILSRAMYNQGFVPASAPRQREPRRAGSHPARTPGLGGRPTVGRVPLEHVIGVRIPASQPAFAHASRELRLGRRLRRRRTIIEHHHHAKAVSPKHRRCNGA